jgi:hypothetical protein
VGVEVVVEMPPTHQAVLAEAVLVLGAAVLERQQLKCRVQTAQQI